MIELFLKEIFFAEKKLQEFTAKCDIIIHLAAINRCNDLEYLYNTNIELTRRLLAACEFSKSNPHIIFHHQFRKTTIHLMANQNLTQERF